jgi:hypothetical protein
MTTKIIQSAYDNLYLKEVGSVEGKVQKIGNFIFTNNPEEAMRFGEGQEAEAFVQQTLTNFFQWDGQDDTAKNHFRILLMETKLTIVDPETY